MTPTFTARFRNGREIAVYASSLHEARAQVEKDLRVCGIDPTGVTVIAPSAALLDLLAA